MAALYIAITCQFRETCCQFNDWPQNAQYAESIESISHATHLATPIQCRYNDAIEQFNCFHC